MSKPLFALVDCNNFFVSCERLFRPGLEGKPVVVLSSGDGCFVARSNEAKALGIPMGAPAFKHRDTLERQRVVQFSANFELYADISRRITSLLTEICPRIEVYSIDESFLDISQLDIGDVTQWARQVRQRVWCEIGVPVSVGIAGSKTLAKLASERAKKDASLGGVLHLGGEARDEPYLAATPISDIWGVGWRLTPRLQAAGIHTALDIARARPALVRQIVGSVHGPQLTLELRGTSCIPLERIGKPQQMIMRGRTFTRDITEMHQLEAALATLTAQAAFRLRQQQQVCRRIALTLETSRHKPGYSRDHPELKLDHPVNDTGELISLLRALLLRIFVRGRPYHQLNVHLLDLGPSSAIQADILGAFDAGKFDTAQHRMTAIDSLNRKFGRGTLRYAAELQSDDWVPARGSRSPRYVSNWAELPRIKSWYAKQK